MSEEVRQRYTSRKFWLSVAAQALFSVLLVVGKLPPSEYVTLSFLALGGYLAGNVIQHTGGRSG